LGIGTSGSSRARTAATPMPMVTGVLEVARIAHDDHRCTVFVQPAEHDQLNGHVEEDHTQRSGRIARGNEHECQGDPAGDEGLGHALATDVLNEDDGQHSGERDYCGRRAAHPEKRGSTPFPTACC